MNGKPCGGQNQLAADRPKVIEGLSLTHFEIPDAAQVHLDSAFDMRNAGVNSIERRSDRLEIRFWQRPLPVAMHTGPTA